MAAAVPCPPQKPAGIERPKAPLTGQILLSIHKPRAPPRAHCSSIPAWEYAHIRPTRECPSDDFLPAEVRGMQLNTSAIRIPA